MKKRKAEKHEVAAATANLKKQLLEIKVAKALENILPENFAQSPDVMAALASCRSFLRRNPPPGGVSDDRIKAHVKKRPSTRYNRTSMAKSPWGDLPISDAHVHFFSRSFYNGLARQKALGGAEEIGSLLNWAIPATDPASLAATWIGEMDRHGIARMCLIASAHGDEASVAAAVSAFPDRFYGYFMLDPTQPDAVQRAEEAGRNPHLHAICLFPAMHTYSIADTRVVPVLEIASDYGLAVFVHCGAISVGVRQKLGLPSQFNMRFSNPLDLHTVALHFPKVSFLVPHFGAGLFREALMLVDLCPNVYLDTSSSNRWMAYEGLDLRTVLRRAIDVVGLNRLLFGTDSSFFPRGWNATIFEQQATALYELGYDREQVAGVFGGNLERMFEGRRSGVTRS